MSGNKKPPLVLTWGGFYLEQSHRQRKTPLLAI